MKVALLGEAWDIVQRQPKNQNSFFHITALLLPQDFRG
ncbi:hypothetical protein EC253486_5244 [Escherichia coli 2534-86]|nr:hypothetical protein EC253486_5244 [Escherichia coli 2534-86]EHW04073.1 hypothetical protein ECDEC8A_4959 [Escherichia coli DEC8A]